MKHVLAASQFTPKSLEGIFSRADELCELMSEDDGRRELAGKHLGEVVATLFYEPSTRTRLSFESAAQRLGMGLISTENASEFSSAIKGETLEDSVRVIGSYSDIVVLRHKETGAAERAAEVSGVPLINAGDGKGEHPTQSLLDLYTIQKELGRLDGLRVVLGGDLANGRTARSLAQSLALYKDNSLVFVSTPELQMGDDIKLILDDKSVPYEETQDLGEAFAEADVVYWTRLQKERMDASSAPDISGFTIDTKAMAQLPEHAILMHPLPRVDEIAVEVDTDQRAAYFRQAANGLCVRMALMDGLLDQSL